MGEPSEASVSMTPDSTVEPHSPKSNYASSCGSNDTSRPLSATKRKFSPSSSDAESHDSGRAPRARPKKARACWTPELHQKFLEAIDIVSRRKDPSGLISGSAAAERARPKEILDAMRQLGDTELTRPQVSSHLQAYRMTIPDAAVTTH